MYRKLNSPRMDFHATRRILLIRVPSEDYVRTTLQVFTGNRGTWWDRGRMYPLLRFRQESSTREALKILDNINVPVTRVNC